MIAIITFLSSPFGRLIAYVVGIGFIVAAVFGWMAIHDHNIRTEAKLEALTTFNQQQMDQVIKDTKRNNDILAEISKKQDEATAALQSKIDEINKNYNTIDDYLKTPEAIKGDRPSSDILKNTFKLLEGGK